ncbi:MAG: MFS transporter [Bacteroidota bacterium]|nr:MFS transporter [Bacteroidota bacterium]
MKAKPKLSFWQIWNMSFGFLGIQFGFALQNANVSRIFETLGANIDDIPILWIAAPVTGLIVQPIIGHWSDKTWCKLGRRRPFFLVGAILASLALVFMPNSPVLWVAAGMLWIMDASINVSMEPFRAFVGDMLPGHQRTAGFAMQSFFIGTGAVVASLLPYMMTNWFGFSNTAPEGVIPDSVKFSFYIGASVFISAVVWTVFSTKEYSPDELKEFDDQEEDVCETDEVADRKQQIQKSNKIGLISATIGVILTIVLLFVAAEKEVYILSLGLIGFAFMEFYSAWQLKKKNDSGLTSVFNDLNNMPLTMKQLSVVQFFSWFALFAMWIYTTTGVTSDKFDMKVDSQMVSFLQNEMQENDTLTENVAEVSEDLESYRSKINSGEEVSIKVTTVKYFLSGRIFNEKKLARKLKASLENYSGTEENAVEECLTHLNKQSLEKDADINYKTLNFIQSARAKQQLILPETVKLKFTEYIRLKEIRKEYNDGADWVGVGFGVYNGFAAVFAFLIVFLSKATSRKITHMIALFAGGLSFLFIFFTNDTEWILLAPFIGIGLAWASILSVPYAILTGSLPNNKMGVYMGIFNFFIVIPQILAASILGFLVKSLFDGEAIYALILGGVSLVIAGIMVLFVKDEN